MYTYIYIYRYAYIFEYIPFSQDGVKNADTFVKFILGRAAGSVTLSHDIKHITPLEGRRCLAWN